MKDKIGEIREPIQPDLEESEFAKTIDGKMHLMIKEAVKNKHAFEAQILSWAMIEEILLPRLIKWIAKELKFKLPDIVFDQKIYNLNLIYLCISHDQELFSLLERCRKQRNEVIHKVTKQKDTKSRQILAAKSSLSNMLLQKEVVKRFSGEFLIPSINLYRNGWNDAISNTQATLKEFIDYLEDK